MESSLTITAISGWALPSEWFQKEIAEHFPGATIRVLYPFNPGDPQEAKRLLKTAPADLYIGYSLGSLWLMTHQELIPKISVKIIIAPILAFTRERNYGGNISETKLKYLIRSLKRNPQDPSSLLEFYSSAGIQISDVWLKEIPENEVLLKGLEFLQTAPVPPHDDLNIIVLAGKEDAFLDGDKLKDHLPQLELISDAGHAPGPLLKRLANILDLESNG